MDSKEKYKVIGLMSGTSLGGVDIACAVFSRRQGVWGFSLQVAQTVEYSPAWRKRLAAAPQMSGDELMSLDIEYGKYLGLLAQAFTMKNKIRSVDFIASHGHTVFHRPDRHLTFQLGNGNAIYAATMVPVVCDFRRLDTALGGQGGPLTAAADRALFKDYDVCLNLGGVADYSMDVKGKRVAADICFANIGLNYLASEAGHPFDKNGKMASDGVVNDAMRAELKRVYQKQRAKKGLSHELFHAAVKPVLDQKGVDSKDKLATFCESIAQEIADAIPAVKNKKLNVLCTGGGVYNAFLMYRLVEACGDRISLIVPEDDMIRFKDALVFGFLGVLRVRREVNCLRSVTGARRDTSGGVMIGF